MMSSRSWLSRYRNGEHDEVWHELRHVGRVPRDSDTAVDAQLVCDEMAVRARRNVEIIVERLVADGYLFHSNDDARTPQKPHLPPTSRAAEHADWMCERFDAVPMTLLSWIRLVGDVWLVGTHPHWPTSASADPLVIEAEGSRYPSASIQDVFTEDYDAWREWSDNDPSAGPFVLPLAPDRLHKQNVSGGSPYGVVLPDNGVDAVFVGETTTPFVAYLNFVFRHGGFPAPTGSANEKRVKARLAKDLLRL